MQDLATSRIEHVADWNALQALKPQWDRLLREGARERVFLTHEWFSIWWQSFGLTDELNVICARDGERATAIAPLRERRAWVRGLRARVTTFIANSLSADVDFIGSGADDGGTRAIIRDLLRRSAEWDLLDFFGIRCDSPLVPCVAALLRAAGAPYLAAPGRMSPYIPIRGTWDEFLAQRSRNLRRGLRKAQHRLERRGSALRIERLNDPHTIRRVLPTLFAISNRSWKAGQGQSMTGDARRRVFFERASTLLAARGWVEVWIATIDGKAAAFEYHLNYRGVTCPIRADFDEALGEFSPGLLLEAGILRRLFDDPTRGVHEYDTCADAYDYICRWTDSFRPHLTLRAFAPTRKGRLLHRLCRINRRRLPWLDRAPRARALRTCRNDKPLSVRCGPMAGGASCPCWDSLSSHTRRTATMRTARMFDRVSGVAHGLAAVARELPRALRFEHDYLTSTRRSALLVLTWACTSRCTTCTAWRRKRERERELSKHEWLDVARDLSARGVREWELFGGDVFLRKDVLVPLAREIHALGGTVHLPINSNLVDAEIAADLAECVDCIYLSTDGVGEVHDKIRGVRGTFGRVNRALDHFLTARGDHERPKLVCNTTVSRHNVSSLTTIAEFAERAGYDEIHFEYVGEFTPKVVMESRIDDRVPSPIFVQDGHSCLLRPDQTAELREQIRRVRRAAAAIPEERGFRAVTANVDALSDLDLVLGVVPGTRCFPSRCEWVIDPYGSIVPCCFFDAFPLASVREAGLGGDTEAKARMQFETLRASGRIAMCRHCISKIARNHSGLETLRSEYRTCVQSRLRL